MRLCLILVILYCSSSFAQNANVSKLQPLDYNPGFEKRTSGSVIPDSWRRFNKPGGYAIKTDSVVRHSGRYSMLLEKDTSAANQPPFVAAAQTIPAVFAGKEVELRAYLKFQDVSKFISLFIRIDGAGEGESLAFVSSQKKQIHGTKDWKQYSIKVKIPELADKIHFGAILSGNGKYWVDDVQVLFDGIEISKAAIKPGYDPNAPKVYAYGSNPTVSRRVKLKDAEIYCETYGQGPPLLLLHGNSQSVRAFTYQIGELSKHFTVIAADTRGQGKSRDNTSGPLSYQIFADDMKALMDSLHIAKASILGWSDGGNTGLIMAMKYPEYVDKLAVMGANLEPSDKAIKKSALKEVAKLIEGLKDKTDFWSKQRFRLFTLLLKEPNIKEEDLKKIQAPTLVMAGERDMIVESHTKAIAAGIPNAKLVIFKGSTHYAPADKPKEFNEAVLKFFKGE